MTTTTGAVPRSMWLLSDNRRSTLALLACLPLAAGAIWWLLSSDVLGAAEASVDGVTLLTGVTAWTAFALVHALLTIAAFRGLRGAALHRALTVDPQWRARGRGGRQRLVRWLMGTGPWSWSVTMSLFALVVVVAMLLQPTLRATTVAPLLAVAMVALAWVDVALTYAVHHARLNTTGEVYRFPGEPPATLLDYVYMAVAVQTTFGTTDVQVMHPRGRRAVVSQGVLAFGFNTVIIGLVIALLVGLT
ncbi:MAG TPA: DUF1345 domain-containing protein [Actinotalea caeni]|uniref:DUF1345 domain-containing protein n=1 Tax=Actinotalea caeni TaxID=1348467 RepID=UPI0012E1A4DD|nr:DUF1345 domain-containing protein [Actinotalea caeni]HLV55887.1 DUF1345 domain-containing protein [Actinotalea caeni]